VTLLSTLETILNPEWLAKLGIYDLRTLELLFDVLNLVSARYFDHFTVLHWYKVIEQSTHQKVLKRPGNWLIHF
jgi:hypothetical protein